MDYIEVIEANTNNLDRVSVRIPRGRLTVITGVSGSGKSSLAFDTILAEAQRRFFATLSHYSRQFLDLGSRPDVKKISGLSPAIGLSQNEGTPQMRVSLSSSTDIQELLGVLFARFGAQYCPVHQLPAESMSVADIANHIRTGFVGRLVAILAPIAQGQKGEFAKELESYANKGFLKIIVNGVLLNLTQGLRFQSDKKNTASLCTDFIKIKGSNDERLLRSLEVALLEGKGVAECIEICPPDQPNLASLKTFSTTAGCSQCGFAWPKLTSRHFSPHSLARCPSCEGRGFTDDPGQPCPACSFTGIKSEMAFVRVGGNSIHDILGQNVSSALVTVKGLSSPSDSLRPAFDKVRQDLVKILQRIDHMGLGYLELKRKVATFSNGETQRLRLASILGDHLRDMIYVLDEPSQGLHQDEMVDFYRMLDLLKDRGNTLICVDHDEFLMRRADWIIDLGPGGGKNGGRIQGEFRPDEALRFAAISKTASYLAHAEKQPVAEPIPPVKFMTIVAPRFNNLRLAAAKIPLERLTVIGGVSGAGKSSLCEVILASLKAKAPVNCERIESEGSFDQLLHLERSALAGLGGSFVATYLDVFKILRELYAKVPEAQILGIGASELSLARTGARCEECLGRGYQSLSMKFLADAEIVCPICRGRRYQDIVQSIKYHELSLPEILELTIDEAMDHFATFSLIKKRLSPAQDLGLGYLKLGQLTKTLSGGEAQRLRLVSLFVARPTAKNLVMMSEPTAGLHQDDIVRLIRCLKQLTAQGHTVVLVEHHLGVILAADWLIELGPGAAERGGDLVYSGLPRAIPPGHSSRFAKWFGSDRKSDS